MFLIAGGGYQKQTHRHFLMINNVVAVVFAVVHGHFTSNTHYF